MAKKFVGTKELSDYVDNVDGMPEEIREFIREELACLGEWITGNSQLKNYREVNKFLHEMLDVSV